MAMVIMHLKQALFTWIVQLAFQLSSTRPSPGDIAAARAARVQASGAGSAGAGNNRVAAGAELRPERPRAEMQAGS